VNTNKSIRIEILAEDEEVFGSINHGSILVTEFVDDDEIAGEFFDTLEEAYIHIGKFLRDEEEQ
jgi:hypothetical protein